MRHTMDRPEVWFSPDAQKAHYKNLFYCGSVWTCPVCASKITERRRVELEQGIKTWRGSVFLVTFTIQHSREDSLMDLTNDLNEGYRALKSGRWWQGFESRHGLAGSVASSENTVSKASGWHPHKHVLFFSTLPADQVDKNAIEAEISTRFIQIMGKRGRYVSAVYGVKVEMPCDAQDDKDQALKLYVSKWGLDAEIAKSPVKNGRVENGVQHYSPFQLLELVAAGDKWAAALFIEYAKAMKGRRQLVYSKGLRKVLGLDQVEKSDLELAEEVQSTGDFLLVRLTMRQWKVILANDARGELLDIADNGDERSTLDFLDKIGAYQPARISFSLSPPEPAFI